ncbi:MAG TPA: formate dehydrogenase accessory sulfurtransferase FdhD [Egicoccus sp.]|nr:formate dehydrogenase accessory sulfurtransferase FdhD [Egicoccus sp.]HSK24062.1 formate dehydrogenase accessory sulfurtransferase FdhD [Egicoccus sp.]
MEGEVPDPGLSASAAVLAGGASRRMGRDKRLVEVDGRPLLRHALDAVLQVFRPIGVAVVVGADEVDLPIPAGVRTVVDRWPGEGPLGGLITALEAADTDLVVVVAGDHHRLVPDVLSLLAQHLAMRSCDAVVLADERGRAQPLLGAYHRRALAPLRAAFDAGERRAGAVLDHLDVHLLPPTDWRRHDPAGWSLQDLDTPEDLQAYAAERRRQNAHIEVVRLRDDGAAGTSHPHRERLAREEPLRIRAAGPEQAPQDVVTTMRSPGHEADLAVGWLFTEGLYDPTLGPAEVAVGDPRDVARPEDEVTVRLPHPLRLDEAVRRHVVATASCGVCGRASIDELAARCRPVSPDRPGTPLLPTALLELPDRLRRAQTVYETTGAAHATGLFRDGHLDVLREDVGRHNALDAAIGARVRAGDLDFGDTVAVLSGRIGFELVAKAAAAGIGVVVAVGAPTDLAVRTADRLGITLVGFVRGDRGNVYSHPERIGPGSASRG